MAPVSSRTGGFTAVKWKVMESRLAQAVGDPGEGHGDLRARDPRGIRHEDHRLAAQDHAQGAGDRGLRSRTGMSGPPGRWWR